MFHAEHPWSQLYVAYIVSYLTGVFWSSASDLTALASSSWWSRLLPRLSLLPGCADSDVDRDEADDMCMDENPVVLDDKLDVEPCCFLLLIAEMARLR